MTVERDLREAAEEAAKAAKHYDASPDLQEQLAAFLEASHTPGQAAAQEKPS